MIKGFFFDLDGTLVDTHRANYEAYHRALLDHNIEVSFDTFFTAYIGRQAQEFLPDLAPGLSREAYQDISRRKADYYKEVLHASVLNAELVRLIEDLQPDHTIALVTTAKRKNAEAVLAHHKLTDLFNFLVTSDDVAKSKPSPEPYLLALQKAGLEPAEVLAFEDSDAGLQAAEAAGLPVVRINKFKL